MNEITEDTAIAINNSHPQTDQSAEINADSNCCTKLSAAGQFTALISNAYLYGNFFDSCTGFSPEILQLSYYGLAFGAAVGLYSTACTVYCQYTTNSINQSDANLLLLNRTYDTSEQPWWKKPLRYALLAGDLIDTVGYRSGALVFAIDIATSGKLTRNEKIYVQLGTTIFGFFTSLGDVQTSKNSLEIKDKIDCVKEQRTKII